MTIFETAALLVTLAAAFGFLNHLTLGLPNTVGLVVFSLAASIVLVGTDAVVPQWGLLDTVRARVAELDFRAALMDGMLAFLLFAGALHVDLSRLRREARTVLAMATLGLILSTVIVGTGFWWLTGLPFVVALVFGALISPTDPVAVLGLLKRYDVPESVEIKIAGEGLFNDGVAVVMFIALTSIAFGDDGHGAGADAGSIALLFVQETVGGAALGATAGWLVCRLMREVDAYALEVLMTLAIVMGCYALAHAFHLCGPLAVVVAGLFVGDQGFRHGMSGETREHVQSFWHLVDEVLNAVLFLFIGVEVLRLPTAPDLLVGALAAVPLVLLARAAAVGAPVALMRARRTFARGAVPIMIWGGLRGGISVALALSLPEGPHKDAILVATYTVVVFSIVVQGLTMKHVVAAFGPQVAPRSD